MTDEPIKKGPGRPRKNPVVQREPARPSKREWKMTATPNWDNIDPNADDSPDRYKIAPDMFPEGMALQWITSTVTGQPFSQHRQKFERGGWTPVHQADFDGLYNGMFMQKDAPGEITLDGLVLMTRPIEMHTKAKRLENIAAKEQMLIKEQALRGGDINTSLDSRHSSALGFNKIGRTIERLDIPKE